MSAPVPPSSPDPRRPGSDEPTPYQPEPHGSEPHTPEPPQPSAPQTDAPSHEQAPWAQPPTSTPQHDAAPQPEAPGYGSGQPEQAASATSFGSPAPAPGQDAPEAYAAPAGSAPAPGYGAAPGTPGTPGSGAPSTPPVGAGTPSTPWYKKWWTWLIGCGCLAIAGILALILILTLSGVFGGGPDGAVKDFESAWNDKDCSRLTDLTTGEAHSTMVQGCEQAAAKAKSDPDMMPTISVDITDTETSGSQATVQSKVTSKGSEEKTVDTRFQLTKTDDGWKINNLGSI